MARLLAGGDQASGRLTDLELFVRGKTVEVVLQFFLRNRKKIDPALQRQRVHRQVIAPDGETQTDAASPLRAQQSEGNTEFENLAERHLDAVAGRSEERRAGKE